MRRLTVSHFQYDPEFGGRLPYIRLKGRWLAKLGWTAGLKIDVEAGESEIVIRKSDPVTGGSHELDRQE